MIKCTPLTLAGLALVLCSHPCNAVTSNWNAAADFSITSNPNVDWSYGSAAITTPQLFQLIATAQPGAYSTPIDVWSDSAGLTPGIFHNTGGSLNNVFGGADWAPGQLALHESGNVGATPGRSAILRWTAPYTGEFKFIGRWAGINDPADAGKATTSRTRVVRNLATSNDQRFQYDLNFGGNGNTAAYVEELSLTVGDTVDFIVANNPLEGFGNEVNFDMTGLEALVITVPEPAPVTMMGLGGLLLALRARRIR